MSSDDNTLKQLTGKRTSIKSKLTIFQRFLDDIDMKDSNAYDISEINTRLERLVEKQNSFDDIQEQIEFLTDHSIDQIDIGAEIENRFFKLIARAKGLISQHVNNKVESKLATDGSYNELNHCVKLPPIDLPKFDGNYLNWRSFEDSFVAFVDKNESLSDVQKLCYLRSKLKNEAFDLIKSLDTTSNNYKIALDLIRDRFSHHRRIVYSHINALLNIKFTSAKAFINYIDQHIRSLESLNVPISVADAFLLPLFTSKLEHKLTHEWETKIALLPKEQLPSYGEFRSFMLLIAETADTIKDSHKTNTQNSSHHVKYRASSFSTTSFTKCILCKESHCLYACKTFLEQDVPTRIQTAKSLKICFNCLRQGHGAKNCKSTKCKLCQGLHNTLLHLTTQHNTVQRHSTNSKELPNTSGSSIPVVSNCATKLASTYQILLSTVEILVLDSRNNFHKARALLDSASQSSFIFKQFLEKLDIPKHNSSIVISGIGDAHSNVSHCTTITFYSIHSHYNSQLSCLLVDKITDNIPHVSFPKEYVDIPEHIQLADKHFNESRPIDLLLGANIFWTLILNNQIVLGQNKPILKNTLLGWIISGPIPLVSTQVLSCNSTSLDLNIQSLWKLDDFENPMQHFSEEDNKCEDLFHKTVKRDHSGRFIVNIPFKPNYQQLGESREIATKRFFALERRFRSDPELKGLYLEFLKEYIKLNHTTQVKSSNLPQIEYFLPHHPVIKESSLTTKLRVVFDGSLKTTIGLSLNDTQFTGPSLQADIFAMLLKFRQHRFIGTADIEKMYRQVLIDPQTTMFSTNSLERKSN